MARELHRVDLIKVDVEGSELPVLRGAQKTLQHHHPALIVEVCEWNFQDAGYSKKDLVRFLESAGYESWIIGPRSALQETRSRPVPDYCNIICLPSITGRSVAQIGDAGDVDKQSRLVAEGDQDPSLLHP
jgi:hypothetical protein